MAKKLIPLTTDAVVFVDTKILLIKRRNNPFKNCWALPGGFVNYGETTEKACLRELKEETDINGNILKRTGVYSSPKRDPRGHTISIAYLVSAKSNKLNAGDDAKEAKWFDVNKLPELAFDHSKIIKDAIQSRNRKNREYDKSKKVIFVSQSAANICWARLICKFVIEKGYVPVNYFTTFGNFVHEIADLETMIDSINSVIVRCDELWAFGKISEGMWHEIKMCKELGVTVKYFCIEKLPARIKDIKEQDIKYQEKFRKKIIRKNSFIPINKLN